MDFTITPEQEAIRTAVAAVCAKFDLDYWLKKDRAGGFPQELHAALARDGWLGIAMPVEYGGAGLGIVEAAIMMQTIAASGAGMSGAPPVHMNIFTLNPVVVFGGDAQKKRWLPALIAGRDRACFGVTEPDTGLDTTHLKWIQSRAHPGSCGGRRPRTRRAGARRRVREDAGCVRPSHRPESDHSASARQMLDRIGSGKPHGFHDCSSVAPLIRSV